MKKGFLQTTIAFIFMTIASTSFAQKVALKLNTGQKLKVITNTETKSTMSAMGQEMETNLVSKSTTQVVVLSNENSTYQIGQTLIGLQTNMQAMGQDMSYDSEKKDNDEKIAESLDKVMNKEKKVTINSIGKIIKQESIGEQEEASMSMMTGLASNGDAVVILMKSLLGQDMKVGNSWIDDSENTAGQTKTKNNLTFSVTNIESDVATIDYSGTTTSEGTMEQMGQEMAITSSNKVTGNVSVNIKNGILIAHLVNISSTGNMEVAGMTIPNNTITKITSKVIAE